MALRMMQATQVNANSEQSINYNSTDAENGAPCWGDYSSMVYLNRVDVWDALHIATEWRTSIGMWQDCNSFIIGTYQQIYHDNDNNSAHDMTTFYDRFLKPSANDTPSVRLLHYNGDEDIVCNWLGAFWFGEVLATRYNLTVL